ncbi:MAG: TRAP-type mannitol/chloroaromatic compound transport system permease small subunit [Candidatus Latescibacterota bacterium]|jgi:TRAP-type mannitol/chloroaromatic compound transport system permease small subunit|tara:strand:- start:840 stop:1319 length:480 start_codon:yes stop_codon:yes gene_type:complete
MQRLNDLIGRSIPWLTLGMVLTTFGVVVLRYLFERGWVWMQEIVLYMHAFTFLLASGYALSRDAHVRVDILYRPASPRRKAWVDLLGSLFLLMPTSLVLLYQSLPFVFASWAVFEGSKDGGGLEAVFLLKTGIPLFCLLLFLQAATIVRRCIATLREKA